MHMQVKSAVSVTAEPWDRAVIVTCRQGRIRYIDRAAAALFATDLTTARLNGWPSLLSPADYDYLAGIEASLWAKGCLQETDSSGCEGGEPPVWWLDTPVAGQRLRVQPYCIEDDGHMRAIVWEFIADGLSLEDGRNECGPDRSEKQLQARRYQRSFESASIAHAVLDVLPLYRLLRQRGLTDKQALKEYLEKTPDFFEAIRAQIRILDANQAFIALYEAQSIDDWNTRVVGQLGHQDLLETALSVLVEDASPKNSSYETSLQDLKGENKAIWLNAEIPDFQHIDDGILVSAFDISAIKATENELEERQQFLATVLRTIPDFIFVFDFVRREHIFVNANLGEYLGYSEEQIEEAGDKLFSYVTHPDDVLNKAQLKEFVQVLARDEIYQYTVRLQDSEGEWRYFYIRSALLELNEQGRITYCVVVARDITQVLKTQESLNEKERRFRLLEENFSDVILATNANLDVDYVSPSIVSLLGYRPEEYLALDKVQRFACVGLSESFEQLADDYEHARQQCSRLAYEGEEYQRIIESEALHCDGSLIPVELKVTLLLGQQYKELQGMLILCRDIRERSRLEADLRLAAKVFESSLEGIYIIDEEGYITQVNKAFTQITGYSEQEIIGQRPAFLSSGWHDSVFVKEIKPVLSTAGYWQGELISRRANGEVFPAAVGISEVRSKTQEMLGYITTFRDITESKNNEKRIRRLAYFDPLTDLPNRSLLMDRLNQELQRTHRNGGHVALLFLDLDRFKVINDSMGHAVGDRLLAEAARRLQSCIRAEDTVARMGGDEFTIILSGLNSRGTAESAAAHVSRKVMSALTAPFELEGREVFISTSIGIAVYPEDGETSAELLKNADTAMYHTKDAGKNGYQFYTESMNARALERLDLQNALHKGITDEEFELCYLTIHDLGSQAIVGAEALLRWRCPDKGVVEPGQFMAVAEESGLSVNIGAWVLQQACASMASWLAKGYELERIAVNVSRLQYMDGNLIGYVIDALDASGLAPHQLELEFTEALLMEDTGYSQAMLQDLKALGVRISVDDFGTGFSSMYYLHQFPISSLKIDRRFVECLPRVSEETQIAQAIIAIAQSFHFNVIAEGVESDLQAEYLASLGCQEAQGYYYGKPRTVRQMGKLLQAKLNGSD
jgi:diguanylate cyclase (GGDEF)-like protein/PAS domain S-box-containing protein